MGLFNKQQHELDDLLHVSSTASSLSSTPLPSTPSQLQDVHIPPTPPCLPVTTAALLPVIASDSSILDKG